MIGNSNHHCRKKPVRFRSGSMCLSLACHVKDQSLGSAESVIVLMNLWLATKEVAEFKRGFW